MHEANSCLGFAVDCDVLWKGAGVTIAGLILFVGSVYVLLAAIFGRYLGYLVLAVCFSGWMIVQSSLWLFGFWAQGPDTPTNLGPRGSDPSWQVLNAGLDAENGDFQECSAYPADPWIPADPTDPAISADLQSVQSTATAFLAEKANEELEIPEGDLTSVTAAQFSVDTTSFARSDDGTKISVVQAHFTGGGPRTTVAMYYDSGSVERYSVMFLGGSIILFVIHLPLLDRAERKRKEFLIGGPSPSWYGPA
jgi:hypothetical protein